MLARVWVPGSHCPPGRLPVDRVGVLGWIQALGAMRNLFVFLALLFAASCASIPQGAVDVPLQELIKAPERYEGKLVVVRGYVTYGFDDCMVGGEVWYWLSRGTCYGSDSLLDAWSGNGYVVGVVSTRDHGHLGAFPFSLVKARAVRER